MPMTSVGPFNRNSSYNVTTKLHFIHNDIARLRLFLPKNKFKKLCSLKTLARCLHCLGKKLSFVQGKNEKNAAGKLNIFCILLLTSRKLGI